MIKTFKQLVEAAKKKRGIIVGVPAAADRTTILTVIQAKREGLADFILSGERSKIAETITACGGKPADFEILETAGEDEAAMALVNLARAGKIKVMLKGHLPTASLMKPVLDKEKGLRTGNLLSDILVVENPRKEPEGLLGMTDGGLNILPDRQQKKQIIENAVQVFHQLGYSCPHIGILAAIETVKEAMPATVDAAELTAMNQRGEISGCKVYGPLALDIAVSREAAIHKGIASEVAGNVHVLVVPNIESGNILGKSFTYYLKIPVAHVVMGAKIPVLIPSRNESDIDKFHSVALGAVIAEG